MAVLNFPDPAGQDPVDTYSPTSTPHQTSNGVTYVWTDGSWSIASTSNGELLTKEKADSYYVEQTGDNMTGNLTIGPEGGPEVTLLKNDGSATFAGNVNIGDPSFPSATGSSGILQVADGRLYTQIDGSSTADTIDALRIYHGNNVKSAIRADGSATFNGDVSTRTVFATGARLVTAAAVSGATTDAFPDGTNQYYFLGKTDGDPNTVAAAKFAVTAKGTIYTDSAVVVGNNAAFINSNGSATFASSVTCRSFFEVARPNDTSNAIQVNADGVGATVQIRGNGSATFAGNINAGNVTFNLETDDPANYTTTTVDGEEQQVYNGPTLDVKERLTKADVALQNLKTAVATAVDFAELKAAMTTALADI